MISTIITTPQEMLYNIVTQAKTKRLELNLSQKSLSERSGVSWGVIKKFEHTGLISLKSLLKLAFVLNDLKNFANLFEISDSQHFSSIKQLINKNKRQRGRK